MILEELNKAKLLMKYNTKVTLSENLINNKTFVSNGSLLTEQPLKTFLMSLFGTADEAFIASLKQAKNAKYLQAVKFLDDAAIYSQMGFKNVDEYIKTYPDVESFLPLVVDTDDKGVFVGFTNEATFAVSINTEMGYLTNDTLMNYQNFQSSGMVIKKSTFENNGGLKPSIKLTFVYEYLLRLTYNSVKIMTIPRIGYKHMNLRQGSIFWNYKNGENILTDDEVSFWIESAKKEHFFVSDRNIKYEPQEV